MYSEAIHMTFPTILTIILLYLIGLVPVYISYKLGNRVLMALSVICGLLSHWVIPPAISMVLVFLKIPKMTQIRIDKRVSVIFWLLVFFAFTFLPAVGFLGVNVRGYYLLEFDGLNVFTCVFYLCIFAGIITSLLLKGQKMLLSQLITMEVCLGCFSVLSLGLFGLDYIVKSGPYITLILLVFGTAGMLYMSYRTGACLGTAGSPIAKEDVIAGLKSAGGIIKDTTGRIRKTVSEVIEDGTGGPPEKCVNCGAEIKPEQAFCPQCGKQIIRAPKMVRRYRCSNCGSYVKNSDSFCGLCGGRVEEVEEAVK